MIHPDFLESFEEWLQLLRNGETPPASEFQIVDKGGVTRRLFHRNTLIHDSKGSPVAIEGIITDITERYKAEKERQESEERFRILSEAASEGIVIHENGIILEANDSFAAMLGYTLPEVVGQPLERFIHPEYLEIVMQHIRDVDETPYEAASVRKDGATIFHETRGKSLPLHGRPVRVTTLHDITDRKKAEIDLRESEERFRHLVEASYEGIMVHSDGVVLDINPHAEEMFGYSREEFIGHPVRNFMDPERWDEIWKAIQTESEGPYETRIVRKDGKILDVEVVARHVPWHGRIVRVAGLRDITESKEMKANIARIRREGEMFLRHELKNLLIPIALEMNRFMEKQPENMSDNQRSALRRTRECIDRAMRMVDALKRLQDMEAGQYTLHRSRCSLKLLIRTVIEELRSFGEQYGVTLRFIREPVKTIVEIDRDLMSGVFSNLILNAIHHVKDVNDSTEKEVTIVFSESDNSLVVKINNRGTPVPPERLETFFDMFNVGLESRVRGTGLGAAYTRLVARAHGGDVVVRSNPEEGTTVTVTLPKG